MGFRHADCKPVNLEVTQKRCFAGVFKLDSMWNIYIIRKYGYMVELSNGDMDGLMDEKSIIKAGIQHRVF